ncbi:unnamed protein product [Symbiodinium natans]|uniref:Uncharacterized protein n=1 Tax=Symbiodinium natans TaxID=878477 RepID=A0A812TIL6_9DINO|nr:unnamed protein product [Symbiodinium natans]
MVGELCASAGTVASWAPPMHPSHAPAVLLATTTTTTTTTTATAAVHPTTSNAGPVLLATATSTILRDELFRSQPRLELPAGPVAAANFTTVPNSLLSGTTSPSTSTCLHKPRSTSRTSTCLHEPTSASRRRAQAARTHSQLPSNGAPQASTPLLG